MCRKADKCKEMAHASDLMKLYVMLGMTHGQILLLLSAVDDRVISRCATKDPNILGTVQKEDSGGSH